MKALYDHISLKTSVITTISYSTSFSMGIRFLSKELQNPIFGIYGFVRLADEIVDSFHDYDQKELLMKFKEEVYYSIDHRISLNPILNSFQHVVNKYGIDMELIELFLESMEMDLQKKEYDQASYKKYILGSAEVVGLMCLKVFCMGNNESYIKLKPYAMALGSAFQKVNFLRDLNSDYHELGRVYFPLLNMDEFDDDLKKEIVSELEKDFELAYTGIKNLPPKAKFGVYLSYVYYQSLLRKIKRTPAKKIIKSRIRIPNGIKIYLLIISLIRSRLIVS